MKNKRLKKPKLSATRIISACVAVLVGFSIGVFASPQKVVTVEKLGYPEPIFGYNNKEIISALAEEVYHTQPYEKMFYELDEAYNELLSKVYGMVAQTVWGEARGVATEEEKMSVIWTILNRVDSQKFAGKGIIPVITSHNQYHGYDPSFPIEDDLYDLAELVVQDWLTGEEQYRTIPEDYYYFSGDGEQNYFR